MKPPAPVKDPQSTAEAERIVARILAQRSYSRAELEQKLRRREVDSSVIATVLDRFAAQGWIDEPALARSFATAAIAKGRGRSRVLREMRARGLERHAEEAWEQAVADRGGDARALLREVVRRRVDRCGGTLDARTYRRVYNALLRAGHDGESVRAELESYRAFDES